MCSAANRTSISADKLRQVLDQSLVLCNHLIVDLSAVDFIDSTILGVLTQTMKNASERGCKFNVVLGAASVVERILKVTGLVPLLNVVPSVEQALAA